METPGVSCWDFAYPDGKCCLAAGKNCFQTDSKPLKLRTELKSNADERFIAETLAAMHSISLDDDKALPINSHHAHSHRRKRSSRGHHSSVGTPTRTYLLSAPTASSICYPQTRTTISTMLMTPHTQLILLVPQSHVLCPKVCEFSRLPRAGGSGMQVLPVAPPCSMTCTGGASVCDKNETEKKGVDDIVKKVYKYTKARAFDGYLTFEEDRANWVFLEQVGKGLKGMAKER